MMAMYVNLRKALRCLTKLELRRRTRVMKVRETERAVADLIEVSVQLYLFFRMVFDWFEKLGVERMATVRRIGAKNQIWIVRWQNLLMSLVSFWKIFFSYST